MQMMESLFLNLFLILRKGPAFLPTSSVPASQHRAALLGTTLFSQICWKKSIETLQTIQMAINSKGLDLRGSGNCGASDTVEGPGTALCLSRVYVGQPQSLFCNDVCIRRSPKV